MKGLIDMINENQMKNWIFDDQTMIECEILALKNWISVQWFKQGEVSLSENNSKLNPLLCLKYLSGQKLREVKLISDIWKYLEEIENL